MWFLNYHHSIVSDVYALIQNAIFIVLIFPLALWLLGFLVGVQLHAHRQSYRARLLLHARAVTTSQFFL
jgi:hypothetical protein